MPRVGPDGLHRLLVGDLNGLQPGIRDELDAWVDTGSIDAVVGASNGVPTTFSSLAAIVAHDYAFRSEQAGVTTLDHLGQYVDGDSGFVNACALTIVY